MLNTIKEQSMVSPVNDINKMKSIDSDRRLRTKTGEPETLHTTAPSKESVNLSSESKQLEALKALLQDIPEINEARVRYFKAEIESGNYEIHSDKIARNMLNNVETV